MQPDSPQAAHAIALFQAALGAVGGESATRAALRSMNLEVLPERWHLLAFGKAASAMVRGALPVVEGRLERGLLVSKDGHIDPELQADSRLHCIESAHPVPDQRSLEAGESVLEFVSTVPAGDHLLVLISGGGSALVEALLPGLELEDLQKLSSRMLAGGLDIAQMNRLRGLISRIKGGRLAAALPDAVSVTQLLISDVPGDEPGVIASGPLIAPHPESLNLEPERWLQTIGAVTPVDPPAFDASVWSRIETRIIASSSLAQAAAAEEAERFGLCVRQGAGELSGAFDAVLERVLECLQSGAQQSGVWIFGGEPTLQLPPQPGRGGRNQHLALALIPALAGLTDIAILVGATDGTDGPTFDAGGVVTPATASRAEALNLDIAHALARADAGPLLEACDALLHTGPTGTNVMDLLIIVRDV